MNGFGSMLKEYLEFHKISQTDFASRLDISVKHMNEILNENTNISIFKIKFLNSLFFIKKSLYELKEYAPP